MTSPHWPLAGLRLRTPRLELRWPSLEDLDKLVALAAVHTGSWIGRRYQGRGIGTEMRAAVLSLAFDDLHAEHARSTAHSDNAASLGVSRKLGYADDGIEHFVVRGQAINARRLLLDRATWQARRPLRVRVSGLAPCLPWFGLGPAPVAAAEAPAGR